MRDSDRWVSDDERKELISHQPDLFFLSHTTILSPRHSSFSTIDTDAKTKDRLEKKENVEDSDKDENEIREFKQWMRTFVHDVVIYLLFINHEKVI